MDNKDRNNINKIVNTVLFQFSMNRESIILY